LKICVEKVVAGGLGLGRREDGCTVLVPAVLPGELVRVKVRRSHRSYQEATLVELLEPSPERRLPPCPWYDRCGGCDLQHASYPCQLELKQQILRELLQRHGLAAQVEPVLAPPLASEQELNYRQRIRLQVAAGRLGFFQAGSHRFTEVEQCLLARPAINRVWRQLSASSPWRRLAEQGEALEFSLDPQSGRVVLLLHHRRRPRPAEREAAWQLCRELAELKGIAFLPLGHQAGPFIDRQSGAQGRDGTEQLRLHFLLPAALAGRSLDLTAEPTAFCQVNEGQNQRLLARLFALLQPEGDEVLADLHCGMGNFSLPLALRCGRVYGVDIQAAAIRGAKHNALANGIENCRFSRAGAREGLAALHAAAIHPDILLLDPPRGGCLELVRFVGSPLPNRIVMISCDPATMVRDLAVLGQKGYRVASMQLIDMFPQTHHLETITLLRHHG